MQLDETAVKAMVNQFDFTKLSGLIPCIAQDHETGQVLMVGFQNEEALRKTLETGIVHYFSRSRQELWKKGGTSGHLQKVMEIYGDCDLDTILVKVQQTGRACHVEGQYTCFHKQLDSSGIKEIQTKRNELRE